MRFPKFPSIIQTVLAIVGVIATIIFATTVVNTTNVFNMVYTSDKINNLNLEIVYINEELEIIQSRLEIIQSEQQSLKELIGSSRDSILDSLKKTNDHLDRHFQYTRARLIRMEKTLNSLK